MRLAILLIIIIIACAGAQAQESVRVNFHRDLSESLNLMQFVDRIQRPCSTGNVVAATVIANPNNSGNVAVTTCQGGNFTINGSTIVPGGGLADPGANGYVVRTALNTTTARTLTGTANQVIISNGTGVAGNSVFSLPQSIATTSFPQFAGLGLNTTAGTAGQLKFGGTTSGIITVHPAAIAGTWDFTLPTTDGNPGEFLQTDGAGVTSWAAAGGGGVTCAGCTNNTLPKTTGAGTLGDSRVTDNGTDITADSQSGIFQAGDPNNTLNGSSLFINDTGLRVDLFQGANTLTFSGLDLQTSVATLSAAVGGLTDNVNVNAGTHIVSLNTNAGTKLEVNGATTTINADSGAGVFQAGDTGKLTNGSFLKIDDANKLITISADDNNTGVVLTLDGTLTKAQLSDGAGVGSLSLDGVGQTQTLGNTLSAIIIDKTTQFTNVRGLAFAPETNATTDLGTTTKGYKQAFFDATITPGGTTGAQVIDKSAGSVNFAGGASSLVVTSNKVTANSIVMCTVATNDTTLKSVQCVAGAGSFTMFGNAAATAETRVNFWILNQ